MSHLSQILFVRQVKDRLPMYFYSAKVLEIGSYNVNGSVRSEFITQDYIGIDVAAGRDVDVVCLGHEYRSEKPFDTVISCSTLEHDPHWKETLRNMIRLCRSGGLVLMTCASTGWPEHGTRRTSPQDALSSKVFGDYYRNLTEEDCKAVLRPDLFSEFEFSSPQMDLFFYGIKK